MPRRFALSRRAIVLGTAAAGLGLVAVPAPVARASAETDRIARRRINLAGRLRMLGQRLGRAAFFTALEVDAKAHLDMLAETRDQFGQTLAGLRAGDDAMGLPAERDAAVLARLDELAAAWEGAGAALANILAARAAGPADIAQVARLDAGLLSASNALVKALVAEHGDKSTDMGLAVAIDVAGRQRMLSQKMAKEVALIALGIDPAATQADLAGTVRIFDGSLAALTDGLPTITLPVPPPHIRERLLDVRRLWIPYRQVVGFVAETGIASRIELGAVAAQADPLLTVMNEAVNLYEKL